MAKNLVRFDWAMKRLLRNKANYVVLEGFLSELLREDILIEQILESEGNQDDEMTKFNRVDMLALNSRKELVIIELQDNSEADYFQRMLFGTSKALTDYFRLGDSYKSVRKVYSINIVYFDLGQGEDYVYHGRNEFVGIHRGDVLGLSAKQKSSFGHEHIYQIYPEYYIIKVNRFDDVAKDTLDQWIYYLKNNQVRDEFNAKGLEGVRQRLDFDALTPDEKTAYIRTLENKSIEKDVIETARGEGQLQKSREIARQMKQDGMPVDLIVKYTALSPDEIQLL
ncbi:Rpn family recombination-promoting nuclease/putative transposase [Arsenicibacter rosenii]|uniref:Rpn family recombination-promoting nuclease/putative transposase n=1 Tax=Arsenicibacter rosenii TaxID=1750698 RepID=A0A1S2VBV2_9BACT|nr:Rpn family recombination-promoting nuclease/putative transposase [Arsenicibacter rosenii]OIN56159.1 hypothetical protein BLX24_26110 [Arsenicibacter rosenii]